MGWGVVLWAGATLSGVSVKDLFDPKARFW